ncbi:MAG: valine--tRNA ligase [Chloroherpetonaceae bacterium]|nr:valine--tRNA ligase [Chloroherpetonaceae bacterium]MDW8436668.1 valine--tRNA ligase [Chloroherpetonaceae bacterium]
MAETLSEQRLDKVYDPQTVESKWSVSRFETLGLFRAESAPVLRGEKKPFVILMPPPNITGSLTMGHVLNNSIQDIFIRYHRMMGYESLWLPGTDHAGIATQTRVERELRKEKLTRYDLGREKFLERVWRWRNEYGDLILKQLRRLGASADWRRNLFTMDESASNAVKRAFIKLHNDGLIYRGKRIINWCPVSQTALSDEEVVMKTQTDKLYFVRYFFKDEPEKFITIATVRPETMLADVAVAVNPNDERYKAFIGKIVLEPLTKRELPIIADDYVEMEFGTGALKITPAHDANDYEIGRRHNLPFICAIDKTGKIEQGFGVFSGLDRFAARKKAEDILRDQGHLEKIEDYAHNVGYSERADVVVEPYLSEQWFVKMKPLAEPALKAVEEGRIKFYPERWVNTYRHWMTNVQDWCISRQLWWGHRIPAYYAPDGSFAVAETKEEAFEKLRSKLPSLRIDEVAQDEDVLDTWFSSWLWPLTTLGWDGANSMETDDFKAFYPTTTLVTGPDIIFFWVARMIIAGLYFKGEIPFRNVYFTSIIRDGQGRKMSKSLGNSPNPLDVIEKYGADALRFTVIYLAPIGQDVRMEVTKDQDAPQVAQGRNFATKVWNAARFLLMNRAEIFESLDDFASRHKAFAPDPARFNLTERWLFSRLNRALRAYHKAQEQLRVNELAKLAYDFIWDDYCDWFIEAMKVHLQATESEEEKRAILLRAFFAFEEALKMLHPIMPFITEEIWQNLAPRADGEFLDRTPISFGDSAWNDESSEAEFELIKKLIAEIRSVRATLGVPPAPIAHVQIKASSEKVASLLSRESALVERLARVSLSTSLHLVKPVRASSAIVEGNELYLLLEGLIDFEKEKARLAKEIQKTEGYVRQLEAKLSNEGFVSRAPKEVIDAEREKLANARGALAKLRESLASLT